MKVTAKRPTVDLDEAKTFYDPHPGFGGAIVALPSSVKKVADELNGTRTTLREAIARIRKACPGGRVEVESEIASYISLEIGSPRGGGWCHGWRVIRYR